MNNYHPPFGGPELHNTTQAAIFQAQKRIEARQQEAITIQQCWQAMQTEYRNRLALLAQEMQTDNQMIHRLTMQLHGQVPPMPGQQAHQQQQQQQQQQQPVANPNVPLSQNKNLSAEDVMRMATGQGAPPPIQNPPNGDGKPQG